MHRRNFPDYVGFKNEGRGCWTSYERRFSIEPVRVAGGKVCWHDGRLRFQLRDELAPGHQPLDESFDTIGEAKDRARAIVKVEWKESLS